MDSRMAEPTGLEPATSHVTGERSNQLNYDSAIERFLFLTIRFRIRVFWLGWLPRERGIST